LLAPGLPPISNVAYTFPIRSTDDLEHVVASIFRETRIANVSS
jgi:hypothetical protein